MKTILAILSLFVVNLAAAQVGIRRDELPAWLRAGTNSMSTTNLIARLGTNLTTAANGGAARGLAATDLQANRSGDWQVAAGDYSVLAGGRENRSGGTASFVGGGAGNTNAGSYAVLVGGVNNQTGGNYQFIGGGYQNLIDTAPEAFIGGGKFNVIENDADDSTLVAGESNRVGPWAHVFVGGGRYNFGNGDGAVLVGGRWNTNSGDLAFIGGGEYNAANANGAIIPGGHFNSVSGLNSFAVGSTNSVTGANAGALGIALTNGTASSVQLGIRSNYLSVGTTFSNAVTYQIDTDAVVSPLDVFTNSNTRALYFFTLQITGDGDLTPSVLFTVKVTNSGTTNSAAQWGVDLAAVNYYNTVVVPVGPSEQVWVESSDSAGSVLRVLRFQ